MVRRSLQHRRRVAAPPVGRVEGLHWLDFNYFQCCSMISYDWTTKSDLKVFDSCLELCFGSFVLCVFAFLTYFGVVGLFSLVPCDRTIVLHYFV